MAKQQKTPCTYGSKCYRKNKQHLEQYSHGEEVEEVDPPAKKRKRTAEPDEEKTKKKTITDFFTTKEKVQKKQANYTDAAQGGSHKGTSNQPEEDDTTEDDLESENSKRLEDVTDEDEPQPECSTRHEDVTDEDVQDTPESPEDIKESIKQKFLMEMPDDFYAFWDFAKTVHPSNPNTAFVKTLGLELVGPFDILGGRHKRASKKPPCYLTHWRYYYDPPEFMTVVKGSDSTQFHMGFFRDDPGEMPVFVASNATATNSVITPRGENLFAAFNWFIEDYIKKNKSKGTIDTLKADLVAAAKEGGFSLDQKTKTMKARDKKVNCKLFHGAGLVVPVDENGVGYREVPESTGDLKKMFKKIADAKTDKERDAAFDPLMEIIMLIQFANDECDYGEGLELGLDMFSYGGEVFKSNILNLTGLAYQLLARHEYKQIIEAHMENRSRSANLSQLD